MIEFMQDFGAMLILTLIFFTSLLGVALCVSFLRRCYQEVIKPEDTTDLADNPNNYKD